jgi:hypothetical protein
MTSTVHSTDRASPFVLTYVAGILPQSENLELKIGAIHLHAPAGTKDGPLPTHYEPVESPVKNLLYVQQAERFIFFVQLTLFGRGNRQQ